MVKSAAGPDVRSLAPSPEERQRQAALLAGCVERMKDLVDEYGWLNVSRAWQELAAEAKTR